MHLTVRVPNTWYRASLEWPDPSSPSGSLRLIGITLPGVPALVVGSNTHVAWGFTNTYADWSDLVLLDVDPQDPTRYRTPDGWRAFDRHDEVIEVAGGPAEHLPVSWTIWGPVIDADHRGRPRAIRWVAHDVERLAVASRPRSRRRTPWTRPSTRSTASARRVRTSSSPTRRVTSAGPSMDRFRDASDSTAACRSRGPTATRGWNGWLSPAEYPRVARPGERTHLDGQRPRRGRRACSTRLGDGSYEVGSRARIIRDRLMARERFTPADLLDIQLDTSASFLARWRDLDSADADAGGDRRQRRTRAIPRCSSNARGTVTRRPAHAGYRLTRMFREEVSDAVIAFVLSECYEADAVLRLPGGPSSRRSDLEARHRTADAPARSGVCGLGARCSSRPWIASSRARTADGGLIRAVVATRTSPRTAIRCRRRSRSSAAGSTCRCSRSAATSTRRACTGARTHRRSG